MLKGLSGGGEKVADWWLMKLPALGLCCSVLRRVQRSEAAPLNPPSRLGDSEWPPDTDAAA